MPSGHGPGGRCLCVGTTRHLGATPACDRPPAALADGRSLGSTPHAYLDPAATTTGAAEGCGPHSAGRALPLLGTTGDLAACSPSSPICGHLVHSARPTGVNLVHFTFSRPEVGTGPVCGMDLVERCKELHRRSPHPQNPYRRVARGSTLAPARHSRPLPQALHAVRRPRSPHLDDP